MQLTKQIHSANTLQTLAASLKRLKENEEVLGQRHQQGVRVQQLKVLAAKSHDLSCPLTFTHAP